MYRCLTDGHLVTNRCAQRVLEKNVGFLEKTLRFFLKNVGFFWKPQLCKPKHRGRLREATVHREKTQSAQHDTLISTKPELYFGGLQCTEARPRTPSLAELPLHFFSGEFCFPVEITEARTRSLRPRAGVVAKPSPLGDERGSVREIGLCD